MKNAVYGIANTTEQAESIVTKLQASGFASSDISVLFPDKEGTRDFAHEKNTKAPEGATTGGLAGMGVGGALGCLLYTSPSPRDGLLSRMPSSA